MFTRGIEMRVVKILLEKKVRWIITIVFMIITLLISWNSDDAYHAYIMAKNFAEIACIAL